MYEICSNHLGNDLRLNEISVPVFFQFYCKINRNQLEIVVEITYGLHPNKYFEILNLTFSEKRLVTRHFELYSNSRGAGKMRDFVDFNRLLHTEKRSCCPCLVLYIHVAMLFYRVDSLGASGHA